MKKILLGNEAIVQGALEAGVDFVSTYPGTPASEIGDTFYKIAKEQGIYPVKSAGGGAAKPQFNRVYFEFSTNEKVALEAAIGASFSGLKCLVAMKNFGLNVASDALLPFCYTGTKGPSVIVVADDPSCWSSAQSEENSRAYAYLAHIPMLEPSDAQEAKDFVKLGFEISEKFKLPVIIRTTTRVAHQRMPVAIQETRNKKQETKGEFIKDVKRFVTLPPRVLKMKEELLEKIEKIKEFSESSNINQVNRARSSVKLGIITSGIGYLYVTEALKELKIYPVKSPVKSSEAGSPSAKFNRGAKQFNGVNLPVLKLGFFYPLPEKKIKNFIKGLKKVLIVEELEPYLEKEITRIAKNANCKLQIVGKELIPEIGELKPEMVISAIAEITNSKFEIRNSKQILNSKFKIPKRLPRLCPGCPYWLVFNAIKKAVDTKEVIFGGDIGCYMLFGTPAMNIQDYLSCMGSSIGIAHGIKKATNQKLITFIGDSTFFHAGIPALINTVFNKSNPLTIVLDNRTTAMTGHQPHPGAPATQNGIKIENIVSACGIKNLKVIDPINQEEFSQAVKEFLESNEVSVIVARRPCIFVAQKYEKKI